MDSNIIVFTLFTFCMIVAAVYTVYKTYIDLTEDKDKDKDKEKDKDPKN